MINETLSATANQIVGDIQLPQSMIDMNLSAVTSFSYMDTVEGQGCVLCCLC